MGKGQDTATNTSCYIQVLGVGTDTGCTVPSALLFFDRNRYLFNAGEGFQRFCVEHKIRMTKLTAILTTRVNTEATGGLPGMLLTMADTTAGGLLTGHAGMTVHGPPGLHTLVNGFRTFVNVKDMGLKIMEFGSGAAKKKKVADGAATEVPAADHAVKEPLPVAEILSRPAVKNEAVSIVPIIIRPTPSPTDLAANGSKADDAEPSEKRQKTEHGTASHSISAILAAASSMDIPSTAVDSAAACYVCELPDIPGKFLPHKAASLGVPRGPLYGQLARGQEVTAVNGRVVRPEDVMEPSAPGPTIAVVDCPTAAFLQGLADTTNGLGAWAADENKRSRVACVVHLTPREVLGLPGYRAFMNTFGPNVQHVLVAESADSKIPILRKSAALQAKLNALDPDLFPPGNGPLTDGLPEQSSSEFGANLPPNWRIGTNMLRYHLRPLAKRGFDDSDSGRPLDVAAEQQSLREEHPDVLAAAVAARGITAASETAAGRPPPPIVSSATNDELVITFLGTGAAIPSKYRNVTGMLVDMPARGAALLMDCGEGSLGQLRRRLGRAGAADVLRRLSVAWISHIHADHHVGLPALLAARTRLLGPKCAPVLVIGPRPLRRALAAYAALEPMKFRFVEAAHTEVVAPPSSSGAGMECPEDVKAALVAAREALGLRRLESVRVIHCAHSFGLVLESQAQGDEGWKVVFSGDTRPCDALVEAAKGATLFIHEATFDDSMQEEAEAKRHCTTREAVEAGAAAGAYRTLLTHFSQRYPKVPVINEHFQSHVGIAFDLMSVRLSDLPRLPALVPAFKGLFAEEEEEDADEEPVPEMLA